MVSSTANPTGNIHKRGTLHNFNQRNAEKEMCFVSEEIYSRPRCTIREEHTRARNSGRCDRHQHYFPRRFCMPGLRVGWMILPQSMIPQGGNP
jgi:aspartate/methionine/tyrosine aminotransferase